MSRSTKKGPFTDAHLLEKVEKVEVEKETEKEGKPKP